MTEAHDTLEYVCRQILKVRVSHPVRIGVNGVDGSGKTVFAQHLARALQDQTQRQVIGASIDSFHNPRSVRYAQGRESPEGYYRDSFNFHALITNLLEPLGPQGDRRYKVACFDLLADQEVTSSPQLAHLDAILIVEGIFLFMPAIASRLECKIFLDVPFDVTWRRMLARHQEEQHLPVEEERRVVEEERRLFATRYMPGQSLYLNEVHPSSLADIVIDNTDFESPRIIRPHSSDMD
jgi:uridine kinase